MARRRGPPWTLIGVVFTVIFVGAVAASLLAPGPLEPPRDMGVCWRMTGDIKAPKFTKLAGNLPNLETCAAYLEREHLNGISVVEGAFQGRFIFVDDDAIRSSTRLDGSKWRVFFDPQRDAIDRKIREGGRSLNVFTAPAGHQGP